MKKDVVVYMLISSGKWIEIVRMKMDDTATKETIQKGIDQLHDMFYGGDKVELHIEGQSFSFRGLNKEFNVFKIVTE